MDNKMSEWVAGASGWVFSWDGYGLGYALRLSSKAAADAFVARSSPPRLIKSGLRVVKGE